jgi:hypothetical protein
MSRKNVRVVIPKNADELIALGESIEAKHTADGASSPLNGLDMATFSTKLAAAKAKNNEQKQKHRDAEMATEERDDLLGRKKDQSTSTDGTVLNIVARSRDILLGLHKGNEQQLGQWGFDVNQSVQSNSGGGSSTSTGSLSGKVSDGSTLVTISGALVEVVGTGLNAQTDMNGAFTVSGIPVGTHTVRVSAVGYHTMEVPITVAAGVNPPLNALLIGKA